MQVKKKYETYDYKQGSEIYICKRAFKFQRKKRHRRLRAYAKDRQEANFK